MFGSTALTSTCGRSRRNASTSTSRYVHDLLAIRMRIYPLKENVVTLHKMRIYHLLDIYLYVSAYMFLLTLG